jgi:hypothetical protein
MEKSLVSQKIRPGSKLIRYLFFIAGISATIAYRITPFLTPFWVKVSWYIGTVGFIIYFWHRSHIENKRAKLVQDYQLNEAVEKSDLQGEQKVAISYLVKTSLTSKARYNSAFIVIVSALALLFSIALDLRIL